MYHQRNFKVYNKQLLKTNKVMKDSPYYDAVEELTDALDDLAIPYNYIYSSPDDSNFRSLTLDIHKDRDIVSVYGIDLMGKTTEGICISREEFERFLILTNNIL